MSKKKPSKNTRKPKKDEIQEDQYFNAHEHEPSDSLFTEHFTFDNDELLYHASDLAQSNDNEKEWLDREFEGQLSVDVYDQGKSIIIKSTIAGVKPEDLDIFVDNDMITIRGKREKGVNIAQKDYYYQECFWGGFSRSIILPEEVQADHIEATLKNGVLTIELPKAQKKKKIEVEVLDED